MQLLQVLDFGDVKMEHGLNYKKKQIMSKGIEKVKLTDLQFEKISNNAAILQELEVEAAKIRNAMADLTSIVCELEKVSILNKNITLDVKSKELVLTELD